MKALVWRGPRDVRIEHVPDPEILNPRDAVVRVTATTICGSDLHLYNGFIPAMRSGDIMGHECVGEVVAVGPAVNNLSVGDRVVVPFPIACGGCFFCRSDLHSLCDNSNPNKAVSEKLLGYATAGIFGYSHLFGGYAGSQAEYVRVPYADVGPLKIPDGVPDEKVLFLSDIFPTGYMAAENCSIQPGDVVAVWGCGPVGMFAIKSCFLLGAERVIAIDRVPDRLMRAADLGAEPVHFEYAEVLHALRELTGGRGPDACIDAVGMEAHGLGLVGVYDRTRQALMLETDRPHVLRQMIHCCRKGGTLSVSGVYAGFIDKVPMGIAFNKGLTFRMGQTPVHRYARKLLDLVMHDAVDPSFVVSHRMSLEEAPRVYRMFNDKADGMLKVVLSPAQRALPEAQEAAVGAPKRESVHVF